MLVWVAFLLGGCRKDLCYDHNHHTERVEYMLSLAYDIEWEYNLESHIDWEQYWNDDFGIPYDSIRPGHPEGVRVHIYDAEDRSEKENVEGVIQSLTAIYRNQHVRLKIIFQ